MPYADKEKRLAYWKSYNAKRKESRVQYNRQYNEKNREKIKTNMNVWSKNNPDKIRKYTLKRRYGTTLIEYEKLLEKQCYCCAICGKHKDEFKKALHLDHCHESKKIRGLLCTNCNTALGHLKEDVGLIQIAINDGVTNLNCNNKTGISKFCSDITLLHRAIDYLS